MTSCQLVGGIKNLHFFLSKELILIKCCATHSTTSCPSCKGSKAAQRGCTSGYLFGPVHQATPLNNFNGNDRRTTIIQPWFGQYSQPGSGGGMGRRLKGVWSTG